MQADESKSFLCAKKNMASVDINSVPRSILADMIQKSPDSITEYLTLVKDGKITHNNVDVYPDRISIRYKINNRDDTEFASESFAEAVRYVNNLVPGIVRFASRSSEWQGPKIFVRVEAGVRSGIYRIVNPDTMRCKVTNHELDNTDEIQTTEVFSMDKDADMRTWTAAIVGFCASYDAGKQYLFVMDRRGGELEELYHGLVAGLDRAKSSSGVK